MVSGCRVGTAASQRDRPVVQEMHTAQTSDRNAFLKEIAIVVPSARAAMKLKPRAAVAGQPKPPHPRTEAMRWTYLPHRRRWLDTGSAAIDHERDAMQTLADFGLGPTQLARIAEAGGWWCACRMPPRRWAGPGASSPGNT